MAESRPSARSGVVLVLALVALFEVFSLLHGVRSVRRLRARVVQQAEQRLQAALPRLAPALAQGGSASWSEIATLALALELAAEVELLDAGGRPVFSSPARAPVAHQLQREQKRRLAAGDTLTVLVQEGQTVRVLSYLPVPASGVGRVLRLAAPAGDLEDELREQQQIFLGHLAALAALALASALVLRRERSAGSPPSSTVLGAYEQAFEKLRDRREESEARHELERRRMEDAIHEKEALARAGELTSGIVHEVRNGLGTIVGYARMIERAGLPEDPAAAARSIREECESLETVVRRFTDFVRLEELRVVPSDLARLLRRVTAHELRGHDGVAVRFLGLDEPLEIPADEEMLERAFENLVRNGIEAAGRGGGHLRIEARRHETACEVRIEDDGPGLTPDHPGEIRPFYTTRPGGLGLGLPLAHKIIVLHGGRLQLEPREPAGLCVSVVLPWPPSAGPDLPVTDSNA